MARVNPTRTPSGIMTFLGGIALLGIFSAYTVKWIASNGSINDLDQRRADGRIATRTKLEEKYREQLEGAPGFVDKAKGIVHVPIKDAIQLTVAELKTKKVGPSSVKVEAPLPPLPPASPDSAEPPPSALPSAPQGAVTIRFAELAQPAAPAPAKEAAPAPAKEAAPAPAKEAAPAPAKEAAPAPAKEAAPAPAPEKEAAPAPAPAATPAPAKESAPAAPAPEKETAAPAKESPAPAAPAPAPAAPAPAAPEQPSPAPASPAPATPAP